MNKIKSFFSKLTKVELVGTLLIVILTFGLIIIDSAKGVESADREFHAFFVGFVCVYLFFKFKEKYFDE